MARFIAIPVAAGDAFYLERKGFSVLVDGGKNTSGFPQMFSQSIKKARADIVVCTHNDEDHSNGIIGFLEAGYNCQEVWLPGRWADCIDGLMQSERSVINLIIEGAVKFWKAHEISQRVMAPSFEQIGEEIAQRLNENLSSDSVANNDNDRDTQNLKFDFADSWTHQTDDFINADAWSQSRVSTYHDYVRHLPFLSQRIDYDLWQDWDFWQIVQKAIEAGERIKRIALATYTNGIPVRWFDHNPIRPAGKVSEFLHVLSAQPVSILRLKLSLFEFLSLTVVNKESLVLYSPPDSVSPGVLFCADSDLQDIQIPVQENDLITVPHHGAQANELAFEIIKNSLPGDFDSLVWVRSDSRSKKRPCNAYRNLLGQKFCTVCDSGPSKHAIKMNGINNLWRRQKNVRQCSCGFI